jgi:hypothetical protein
LVSDVVGNDLDHSHDRHGDAAPDFSETTSELQELWSG